MFIPLWFVVLIAIAGCIKFYCEDRITQNGFAEKLEQQKKEIERLKDHSFDREQVHQWLSDLYSRVDMVHMEGWEVDSICDEIAHIREKYNFYGEVRFITRSGTHAKIKGC